MLRTVHSPQQDHEVEILADLYQAACDARIDLEQTAITNFYIALKSKPQAILTGSMQIWKIELIRQLAQVLTENDHYQ